jgi:hypothetical protein
MIFRLSRMTLKPNTPPRVRALRFAHPFRQIPFNRRPTLTTFWIQIPLLRASLMTSLSQRPHYPHRTTKTPNFSKRTFRSTERDRNYQPSMTLKLCNL